MSKSKAAYLEPHEETPEDIDKWLEDWGFDISKPYTRKKDKDNWWWFFQDTEAKNEQE